jgi:phage host-nuclease inhibitor protein Gam
MAKRKNARYAEQTTMLSIRVSPEFIELVDKWCRAQRDEMARPTRSAAIKYLVERGISRDVQHGRR